MARDYKAEYANYHSSDEQKKNRAARNKARRAATREGRVSKGDGKDIGHTKALKYGGSGGSTVVQSRSENRSHGGRIGDKAGKAAGGKKSRRS